MMNKNLKRNYRIGQCYEELKSKNEVIYPSYSSNNFVIYELIAKSDSIISSHSKGKFDIRYKAYNHFLYGFISRDHIRKNFVYIPQLDDLHISKTLILPICNLVLADRISGEVLSIRTVSLPQEFQSSLIEDCSRAMTIGRSTQLDEIYLEISDLMLKYSLNELYNICDKISYYEAI